MILLYGNIIRDILPILIKFLVKVKLNNVNKCNMPHLNKK